MQEAPMIPMTIGLLKRIEDSMLKVRIVFVAVFKEKILMIESPPGQSPGLPMSDWCHLSTGLYRVYDY